MAGHIRQDLVNRRFGRLVAIEIAEMRPKGTKGKSKAVWRCHCDCGNTRDVERGSLIDGRTMSCGCSAKESSLVNLAAARAAYSLRTPETIAKQKAAQQARRVRERDRKRGRLDAIRTVAMRMREVRA